MNTFSAIWYFMCYLTETTVHR